jgi:hypothetical protein
MSRSPTAHIAPTESPQFILKAGDADCHYCKVMLTFVTFGSL